MQAKGEHRGPWAGAGGTGHWEADGREESWSQDGILTHAQQTHLSKAVSLFPGLHTDCGPLGSRVKREGKASKQRPACGTHGISEEKVERSKKETLSITQNAESGPNLNLAVDMTGTLSVQK